MEKTEYEKGYEWKEVSLDASAEEACKKIGILYRRE